MVEINEVTNGASVSTSKEQWWGKIVSLDL